MKLLITSQATQVVKSSRWYIYRTGTLFIPSRSNIQPFFFLRTESEEHIISHFNIPVSFNT